MANARQRITFGLLVTVLGAAVAWIASTYVVDHGWGKIAAGVIGGLAWPVLPGVWQLVGERRRKAKLATAKKPASATLTGYDRYWLRFVVVAAAVLGPMFGASRLGVFGSVKRQATWFVPAGPPPPRDFKAEEHLLKRVPADAELVFVMHVEPENGKKGGSGVMAWGNGEAMIAADDSFDDGESHAKKLEELNANRDKIPFVKVGAFSELSTSDHTIVVVTDGWKAKVEAAASGPSAELRGELARAPASAMVVIAFAPKTKISVKDIEPDTIQHGVAWFAMDEKTLSIAGRVDMKLPADATKLHDELGKLLGAESKDIPEACKEQVGKLASSVKLDVSGTVVSARAELPTEALMGLMFCAMK